MESMLLDLGEELMDADEAASLLVDWGTISERDVDRLNLALSKAEKRNSVNLPKQAFATLAIIQLLQMVPPTMTHH